METKVKTKHVTTKAVALIKQLHNPPVGAKEFSGGWCPERCDALLFTASSSFMIETKVSRGDFLGDKKKSFRQNPEEGVGNFRYYACPIGLIKPEELPDKWGLIYVDCEHKIAKASMPAGYGGYIRDPKNDIRHPQYGTKEAYKTFGSESYNNAELIEKFNADTSIEHWGWKHPEQPQNKYRFQSNAGLERQHIFALATRYKTNQFMENML